MDGGYVGEVNDGSSCEHFMLVTEMGITEADTTENCLSVSDGAAVSSHYGISLSRRNTRSTLM